GAEFGGPLPAAERVIAGVEWPFEQFARKSGIRGVETVALATEDRTVQHGALHVHPQRDQDPHRASLDLVGGRVRPAGGRAVRVADVEVAGPDRQCRRHGEGDDPLGIVRAHGQNPMSIEKKKLRLGGNGATSMFRAIAWLPKFDTSGSSPLYGVNRSRLRPLKEMRAVRIPKCPAISDGSS